MKKIAIKLLPVLTFGILLANGEPLFADCEECIGVCLETADKCEKANCKPWDRDYAAGVKWCNRSLAPCSQDCINRFRDSCKGLPTNFSKQKKFPKQKK